MLKQWGCRAGIADTVPCCLYRRLPWARRDLRKPGAGLASLSEDSEIPLRPLPSPESGKEAIGRPGAPAPRGAPSLRPRSRLLTELAARPLQRSALFRGSGPGAPSPRSSAPRGAGGVCRARAGGGYPIPETRLCPRRLPGPGSWRRGRARAAERSPIYSPPAWRASERRGPPFVTEVRGAGSKLPLCWLV